MYPKCPANRLSGNTPREDLATKGIFSLHRPLESCTTRESCHSWVFRLGVAGEVRGEAGRGVPARRMRLAHAPPALCEAARCFRGLISCSFELSPLTRTMLLLLRLLSRETCSLPPPARGAYVPRRPMRGKRIRFASLGLPLAFHAPSLPCAFVPRRRALLNWLALCMRVTPTAPLPRLCCGRSDGIGGGATSPRRCICPPRRLRAASSRPRLHHPVHITVEAAGLCRLPQKTWRCDGVSLNCCCSAVLF